MLETNYIDKDAFSYSTTVALLEITVVNYGRSGSGWKPPATSFQNPSHSPAIWNST